MALIAFNEAAFEVWLSSCQCEIRFLPTFPLFYLLTNVVSAFQVYSSSRLPPSVISLAACF